MKASRSPRIGIDLGGTKIAGAVVGEPGAEITELRVATPRDYDQTLEAIADVVRQLEVGDRAPATVGIGIPGSLSPATGRVQNANSTWLNGRPFDADLGRQLGRCVRVANDANCFALSEACDGAAAGARSVFAVILGTGCGGGLVFDGHLIDGPRGIGGEWGHNPLPWASADEHPGPLCWCGRFGCMETWVSGPALSADHARATGETRTAFEIAALGAAGDAGCRATLDRHADRLARGLAAVINVFDAEVIVIGGGLSRLPHLYQVLPRQMARYIFADASAIDIRPPRWGDASGLRGAARLWD